MNMTILRDRALSKANHPHVPSANHYAKKTPAQERTYTQGRRINCTRCNQPFDVVDPSVPPVAPPLPNPGTAPAGYNAAYMPPPKRGMSGGMIALLVCGVVFLVLLVVCGGLVSILLPSLNRAREQA
ncbi:MAG TPA: hypothetical protein VHY37_03805, partial [Tepidisphaeraceae bacterium]|nr:hypothetical protein [Tepidisphaeraceae bacterium]